ncbi:oligomeric Golgi complex component [Cavenderia fasciculata]|uniref:Oligomeric Golgi complex component n=1 Tax=Cavenderia fasciculata TaxID=261658 RepID=F4Q419_CACFS|nr:oligomeric Golgi complex component [Cavenderia fasciculata]EGG16933.1 oligomeric Golgi complex component [Cavenderia fasciculata]|eukprot:XP_004355407.1 oligomeric Golgi complex component [Cavenderia fasciculata]
MEHRRQPSSGSGSATSNTTTSTPTNPSTSTTSTSAATQIHQQLHLFEIATWERKSKISIEQSLAVNNLSKAVLDKPLPLKFQNDIQYKTKNDESKQDQAILETTTTKQNNGDVNKINGQVLEDSGDGFNLPSKPIDSLGHFFDWFALIEKTSNHLHQYEWFLETIISYGEGSNHLLEQVNGCEKLVNSIQSDYINLTKKTNQLHESCEKFFKEELRLRYIVQTIHEKLKYYLELEQNTKKFNSSAFSVTDTTFLSSLETLEDCILFMKKNPNYLESSKYSLQYNLLFTRALGLIKDYISTCLKTVTAGIVTSAKTATPQTQDLDNDASFAKIKFRAFAPKLKPLCQELEKRAVGQYSVFLSDTHRISVYHKL